MYYYAYIYITMHGIEEIFLLDSVEIVKKSQINVYNNNLTHHNKYHNTYMDPITATPIFCINMIYIGYWSCTYKIYNIRKHKLQNFSKLWKKSFFLTVLIYQRSDIFHHGHCHENQLAPNAKMKKFRALQFIYLQKYYPIESNIHRTYT